MLLERKKSSYAEYRKTKSEMQYWLVAQKIMQENLKEDEQKKSSCMSRKCGRKKKIDRAVDDVECPVQCGCNAHATSDFFRK